MNQETKNPVEKQSWKKRFGMFVVDTLFAGFCTYEMDMSPYETQIFMTYSGFGWEEAMMAQSLTRLKLDDEVVP